MASDEMPTSQRSRRCVAIALTLLVVHAVTNAVDHGDSLRGSAVGSMHWRARRTTGSLRDGPPIKPDHFRSVAELNKYLAELNEYYTVLGRPRSVRLTAISCDFITFGLAITLHEFLMCFKRLSRVK